MESDSNVPGIKSAVIGGMLTYTEGPNLLVEDVQIYNISLSQNDITTIYDEGIGGAPIALPWLVGWWPLNGNGNDYSGNNNNGAVTNTVFITSWTSGYSAP